MNKILTVGVAAYNVSKDIPKCLSSLLIPSILNDIEILVINDGSTDNTDEVVRKFELEYPETVKLINKENGGHGSAINKTIELAHGKYLKMVDADDSVEKEGFLSLINNLKSTDVDLIFSPYYRVDIKTEEKEKIGYLINDQNNNCVINKKVNLEQFADQLKVAMHSITYRTKILRESKYRIDEHCFYVDVEYTIYYLLEIKNILMLSDPVYDYYIGSDEQSVNIDNMRKRRDQHLRVAKSLVRFYENEHLNLSGSMNKLIENNIVNMILATEYKLLMAIKNSRTSYEELHHFDEYLRKSSPILYSAVEKNKSKKIKILTFFRKTSFKGYITFHKVFRKKLTETL